MLHAGAALDLIGARVAQVRSKVVTQLLADHPRLDFPTVMPWALREQAKRRRHSRAAVLVRIGINELIRAAPF